MNVREIALMALLLIPLAGAGCQGQAESSDSNRSENPGSDEDASADMDGTHPDMPVEPPDPEDPNFYTGSRGLHRMDIDQLNASVRHVTGGIGWEEEDKGQTTDLLLEYSDTLGVPDYIFSVDEDLSASVIFSKFVDDLARDVCQKLMERERNESNVANRTFLVHAEPADGLPGAEAKIRENLAYLLLRFHGTTVSADSGSIDRWQQLFAEISQSSGDPVAGWNGVCVALIRHPDFYTY